MFSSISVYAAPISRVMAGDILFRFGDVGVYIEEWSEELSASEDSSMSDIIRFVFVFVRLLCGREGWSRSRGVEVTFMGDGCKNRYVSRQANFGVFTGVNSGVFTGVNSMLLNESGELRYFSLRSGSVPYPLSASMILPDLGPSDFGGNEGRLSKEGTVRGLTAIEDSRDCAWLAVAGSEHR